MGKREKTYKVYRLILVTEQKHFIQLSIFIKLQSLKKFVGRSQFSRSLCKLRLLQEARLLQ